MDRRGSSLILRALIGAVWLVNGLFCKMLGWVPRHQEIVAGILGDAHAPEITRMIGLGEVALAVWVWSGIRARWNAVLQMALVTGMNLVEFIVAFDLLLWGRLNALFAALFVALVFFVEFVLNREAPEGDGGSR